MRLITLVHLDSLTAFGLLAVSLMLAFYAVEERSRHYVLAFAGACVLGSAYGFLQGAWPFGVVEGIWSLVAVRRWMNSRSTLPQPDRTDENVDALLTELRAATRSVGPTTYGFPAENGEMRGFVQIYRPANGQILIHRLWSTHPGQGCGSFILKTLCELADRHSVRIILQPLPFGPEPHPKSGEQLQEWYHRHGFAGSAKRMIRQPVLQPTEK